MDSMMISASIVVAGFLISYGLESVAGEIKRLKNNISGGYFAVENRGNLAVHLPKVQEGSSKDAAR